MLAQKSLVLLVPALVLVAATPGVDALPYYFYDGFESCLGGQHAWTVAGGNVACGTIANLVIDPAPAATVSRDVLVPIVTGTYVGFSFIASSTTGDSDLALDVHFDSGAVVTLRITDAGSAGNNGYTFCTPLVGCESSFASWSSGQRPVILFDPAAATARALTPSGASTAHAFASASDTITKLVFTSSETAPSGMTFLVDNVIAMS